VLRTPPACSVLRLLVLASSTGEDFEVSLPRADLPRGVAQGLADGPHGGRVRSRGPGGGEDRSLEALLTQPPRGDLRHRRGQQRRGLIAGVAAGASAYVVCSVALADVPPVLAVTSAIPVLAFAPRLMPAGRPRPGSPRRWPTTALTCGAASLIVGAVVITSRLAGPEAAGAVAALPTASATLAVLVVTRDGSPAGAHALTGLVRSLPCYMTFCLVVALAAPSAGLAAIALGLVGCLAAARATWRGVPVARRAAFAR
jgi:hypothetical protein